MVVTQHAIERFRERTGCQKTDESITRRLIDWVQKGQKARYKHPKYAVKAILNHAFEIADYYHYNGWIIVVVNDTIKTVYAADSRWEIDVKSGR